MSYGTSCLTYLQYKHALIRKTRIRKKRFPWITQDLLEKMRSRDFLREKLEHTIRVNNLLKQYKRYHFRSNLDSAKNDPKKTFQLINYYIFCNQWQILQFHWFTGVRFGH